MQIVAFALKEGVLLDVQNNIQIAGRSAERARFAQSGEPNASAVLHSRRHLGLDHALAQQTAFAFALRTRIGNDATRALASRAGSSNAEKALLIPHLPAPVASPASDRSFSRSRAVSAASFAGLMAADIHVLLGAKYRFVKFEMQVFAQVRSTLSPAAPPPTLAKHVAKTKDVAKDVAEILKDGRIESRRAP